MDLNLNNWLFEVDANNIAWLKMNKADSVMNTFSIPVLQELEQLVDHIEKSDYRGIIFTSAKRNCFIAGADIEQFTKVKTEQESIDFLTWVHGIYNRIEALPMPTVAMINGVCLGGGMELALACRYRVADDDPKVKLGLPEVMLGIFPGWGGSVRLCRLIGAIQAMGLMLTGRTVNGKAAAKMGIVDSAMPARHLEKAAVSYVLNRPAKHQPTKLQALTNHALVRPLLANKMRKQVAANKVTPDHYPAPYALIANWQKYGISQAALDGEIREDSKLVVGDTAQNLIRVFFLQQRLKSIGKGVDFKVNHVHVIGAGTMGGDIAAWCAFRGMKVTLQDREIKYIAPAIKRAAALYQSKLKKPELVQQVLDRLIPDVAGKGIEQADVVIEAIFENLEAKQKLFLDLEQRMKPGAIMASNTSSIPLDEINSILKNPEKLVGIHFFNPVAKMPLVEVVKGAKTSEEMVNKATAFVRAIDRLPLPVKSHPGFLVNRILMPYLVEALVLFEEGVPPALIDKAAVRFGMPMGPIELADKVGLDICLHVAKNLAQYFGGTVPDFLEKKIAAGELGVKSGKGFYSYDTKGKPIKSETGASKLSESIIADRLILRYLNEAAACLREGIATDADLIDAGMIFGTGFAPFRGGPLHYAKHEGTAVIKAKLKDFAQTYGDRYQPDAEWDKL